MGKFSNWSKEEDYILMEMIESTRSKKWIKTSLKLNEKGYNRSPSECRQRFINYLAPNIDKSEITQSQLKIIYERYEELGSKWSLIQQYVKCKTQCKIKNVFYGNVKNLLKTVYKFFTFKTAPFINTISTDYLQSIYDGSLEFDGMTEAKEGIRAMSYRNNKYELIRYIQSHKKRFLDLLNAVLREIFNKNPIKCAFNQEHEKRINKLLNNQKQLNEMNKITQSCEYSNGFKYESNERESDSEEVSNEEEEEVREEKMIKVETNPFQIKCEPEEEENKIPSPSVKQEGNIFPFENFQNDNYFSQGNDCVPYSQYYPYPYYYIANSF